MIIFETLLFIIIIFFSVLIIILKIHNLHIFVKILPPVFF